MDKASDFGSRDCRFESCHGRKFSFSVLFMIQPMKKIVQRPRSFFAECIAHIHESCSMIHLIFTENRHQQSSATSKPPKYSLRNTVWYSYLFRDGSKLVRPTQESWVHIILTVPIISWMDGPYYMVRILKFSPMNFEMSQTMIYLHFSLVDPDQRAYFVTFYCLLLE